MKQYLLLLLIFVLLFSFVSATITDYRASPTVRLGENITLSGFYSVPNTLCSFFIYDSNHILIERWSDEYSTPSGFFSAQRQSIEPPYYRGDDFNAVTICGTDIVSDTFEIVQPLAVAHFVQQTGDFVFESGNIQPVFFILFFVAIVVIVGLIGGFIYKTYTNVR